jgi:hypothetical protein
MFYYNALKYGNFLLETLDTFPLLKDAYTQSRKLYENRIFFVCCAIAFKAFQRGPTKYFLQKKILFHIDLTKMRNDCRSNDCRSIECRSNDVIP